MFLISCSKSSEIIKPSTPKDSLEVLLDLANTDSLDVNLKLQYNKKALKIISLQKNDSLNRVNYFKVANRFYNINALNEYKFVTQAVIKKAINTNDSISLSKGYDYLADYFSAQFEIDSAYKYNSKSEKIYIRLNDKYKLAKTLLNKAIFQHNANDLIGCEKTVFLVLQHLRGISESEEIRYQAYNLLGIIYGELTEYNLSEKYYQEALKIAVKVPSEYQSTATTLNNLGILYRKQNNDDLAIRVYTKALSQKNLFFDRPIIYAMLKDNLAYSNFKKGDFSKLPNLFFESLKIRDSLKIVSGIIINKIHLGEYYLSKKDSTKARKYALEAYDLAQSNGEKTQALETLKLLSRVNPIKALSYSEIYYSLSDSLQIIDNKARNKFARIEFETEELTLEKDKLVEQRKTLIYIGLGIILIGVFIFVIRFQAAKNRELMLVQEQQKANEEIYQLMLNQNNKIEEVRQSEKKRIAQELHDGILGKLFGTRMNLGVLNSKKDDLAISERGSYIDELKTLEQEIREISHDLSSEKTAVFNNFVLMVTNFLETQKKVCKAQITFSIDPKIEWNAIDNMAKINFYRILQEAFQNINKYANAKNVAVKFLQTDNKTALSIQDDGVGFIFQRKKKGIGLLNMNSRIINSGGEMHIETEPGKGTLLKFELPQTPIQT